MKFIKLFITITLFIVVSSFSLNAANKAETTIKIEEKRQIITKLIDALNYTYIYPSKIQSLIADLNLWSMSESFKQQNDRSEFIDKLQKRLSQHSQHRHFDFIDKHLDAKQNSRAGIEAEILEQDIGVIKITGSLNFNGVETVLADNMRLLANAKALIIDIADAEATSFETVNLFMSYFFKANFHLSNLHLNNQTQKILSVETSKRTSELSNIDLYLLTSPFVTGSWEYFAYNLKQFDKATVVGMDTIGQGYFHKKKDLSSRYAISIAYAKTSHPKTNSNWHQVGVSADHYSETKSALTAAYRLASAKFVPFKSDHGLDEF